jgi:hypothetical protein
MGQRLQAPLPIGHAIAQVKDGRDPALSAPVNGGGIQTLPINGMTVSGLILFEVNPPRQKVGRQQFKPSWFRVVLQGLGRIKENHLMPVLSLEPLTQKKPVNLTILQNEGFQRWNTAGKLRSATHVRFLTN